MKKKILVLCIILILLLLLGGLIILNKRINHNTSNGNDDVTIEKKYNNSFEGIELSFLKLENKKQNMIYSPLSIKYALSMLKEGSEGKTKKQIEKILSEYNSRVYENSENLSFANALFIKDSKKDNIKKSYIDLLNNKYGAEVLYDSFVSPLNINNWVSNKTLNLINNIFDDVSDNDYILINALAIDMLWKEEIQSEERDYQAESKHEKTSLYIQNLSESGPDVIEFNDKNVESLRIGALVNRYDIVKELGEEKIRSQVLEDYNKWKSNKNGLCSTETDQFNIDNYIKELDDNYNKISSSTDFSFYIDNDVKVFSKDLNKYGDVELQYIGIMPKKGNLKEYIEKIKFDNINNYLNNLKSIKIDDFEDGYVTRITGSIPIFEFDYTLSFIKDLKTLGIKDVFDKDKANLSNISTKKSYVSDAGHKANISFSNKGIKAAAVTYFGAKITSALEGCKYDYLFDVKTKEIDLTFNKPYLFIIRDKNSKDVWFIGTVYKPKEYSKKNLW